jgi:hypothetical protein
MLVSFLEGKRISLSYGVLLAADLMRKTYIGRLAQKISVHYAYLDCYNAVDFETKLAPNSTASIAVNLNIFNGNCEHTYPLQREKMKCQRCV